MLGFLRRRQPRNPLLAVLFWAAATLIALAVLFVLFYWLDNFLPGQGMF
ncbi:MAG TPA: hypothetical protein VE737_06655 [Actinomycetota bacterium]|jgi:hypothetical protein|nr:hypothetical protein [Actinomycetota bacterium]